MVIDPLLRGKEKPFSLDTPGGSMQDTLGTTMSILIEDGRIQNIVPLRLERDSEVEMRDT